MRANCVVRKKERIAKWTRMAAREQAADSLDAIFSGEEHAL
jgi:hypothetical protein